MKTQAGVEQLLDDIVGDGIPENLRDLWLKRTLAEVRRRQRRRSIAGGALSMGIVMVLSLALWRVIVPVNLRTSREWLTSVVRSHPLDSGSYIQTRSGSVMIISSMANAVATVSTRNTSGGVAEIDDEHLLTLVAGKSAALVRSPFGQEELVFANPDDAAGFAIP